MPDVAGALGKGNFCSLPFASKRQSSTFEATSENRAKLVPAPS